jgi:acyl carrier protein
MSTTTTNTIEMTVVESLKSFGAKTDEISRDATSDAIDVDSPDLAELAQIVEDEHGVKMEGDDMKDIRTVDDAIDFITEKKES